MDITTKAQSIRQSISPECAAKEVRKAADMAKITDADRALYDVLEAQQIQAAAHPLSQDAGK